MMKDGVASTGKSYQPFILSGKDVVPPSASGLKDKKATVSTDTAKVSSPASSQSGPKSPASAPVGSFFSRIAKLFSKGGDSKVDDGRTTRSTSALMDDPSAIGDRGRVRGARVSGKIPTITSQDRFRYLLADLNIPKSGLRSDIEKTIQQTTVQSYYAPEPGVSGIRLTPEGGTPEVTLPFSAIRAEIDRRLMSDPMVSENSEFLTAVDAYKEESTLANAQSIVTKFIGNSAERQANISGPTGDAILAAIESGKGSGQEVPPDLLLPPDLFKAAQKEIFSSLNGLEIVATIRQELIANLKP